MWNLIMYFICKVSEHEKFMVNVKYNYYTVSSVTAIWLLFIDVVAAAFYTARLLFF